MLEIADNGIVVAMVVRDADAVLDFYQNTLGMKMAFTDSSDAGVVKYYLRFKGGLLKLIAPDQKPELATKGGNDITGYRIFTLLITNMADAYKTLEEKGVNITVPLEKNSDGTQWTIFTDPEGNMIELAQPA